MNKDITTQLKVLQCCQCQNDVEFYCRPCKQNLCITCKQKHAMYLDTKGHDVVIYRLKHGDFIIPESCDIHPNCKYKIWCKSCECPTCDRTDEHQGHRILDIISACTAQRQEHRERLIQIRGESLPYNRAILAGLKSDVKIDRKSLKAKLSSIQQELAIKAANLIKLIEIHSKALNDLHQTNIYMDFVLKHQNIKEYVLRYEKLAKKPVKFLLFTKKTPVPKTIELPDNIKWNFSLEISIRDIFELLVDIKTTETGKRQARNEHLLRLIKGPIININNVVVTNLNHGGHISFVTPDRIWVSDGCSLILTNSEGENLHHFFDVKNHYGVHTVNNAGELIYVDTNLNINKLSADNTTKSTLIKRLELWEPLCICYAPFTGDLLVMMKFNARKYIDSEVKIIRYNSRMQPVQFIQYGSLGLQLYSGPIYITENRNGDVVVSDKISGLVVTDIKGNYRFTYRGSPNGSALMFFIPYGTCVDAFLNILICSRTDHAIHVIDKDGHLLSIIPTRQDGMVQPLGLGYEEKNHLVWIVSTNNNKLCVYRYVERQDYLADIS
ncbi:uncharacterized protein LOC134244721 [Saccostrea cucullata]|uniref:uncharacterized protein LOC134244721 n=1 Tax=Saccostrea cuccullata TaxID=36930 RepID=UPI002ED61065